MRAAVLRALMLAGLLTIAILMLRQQRSASKQPSQQQLDGAVLAYRAAGLPWTAKDLEPNPPVKAAENAAPLLGIAAVEAEKVPEKWVKDDRGGTTRDLLGLALRHLDSDPAELEAELQRYAKPIKYVELAAQRPKFFIGYDASGAAFNPDRDFINRVAALAAVAVPGEPSVTELKKELGKLGRDSLLGGVKQVIARISARAELHALRHNGKAAADDVRLIFTVGALTAQEPSIMSELAADATTYRAIETGVKCAERLRDAPDQCKPVEDTVQAFSVNYKPLQAIRGEVYRGLAALRALSKEQFIADPNRALELDGTTPRGEANRAAFLDAAKIWIDGYTQCQALSLDRPALEQVWNEEWALLGTDQKSKRNDLVHMYALQERHLTMIQADVAVRRAVLAALQYKQASGSYPTRLNQMPGKFIDPFTGSPVIYKNEGPRVRAYSVGPNRRDDGGLSRIEARTAGRDSDDVVATFPQVRFSDLRQIGK